MVRCSMALSRDGMKRRTKMKKTVKLLSHLPLGVHYFFADYLVYPLIYHCIRYRRKVVRKNLKNSFPDYSAERLREIERAFYHHFTNVIAENIYGYSISDAEMRERVEIHNLEYTEAILKEHGGLMMMLGHYGNWEWMCDIAKRFEDPEIQLFSVYRELKNKTMDDLMYDLRRQRGTYLAEKRQVLRVMIAQRAKHIPTMYGMLSDQKPSPKNAHFWMDFLNQDTSFIDGSEVLGRKFDYPIAYFYITSPKRGYYHVDIRIISEHPNEEEPFAITQRYAKLLEENIREQPHLWLWTHNRWKWNRDSK